VPSHFKRSLPFRFAGVKRPGRGVYHTLPYSAEVKERVELYLCPVSNGMGLLLFMLVILHGVAMCVMHDCALLRYSCKGKGKGHPCTGTEALYRPYGP
jgi:hypothetical protein